MSGPYGEVALLQRLNIPVHHRGRRERGPGQARAAGRPTGHHPHERSRPERPRSLLRRRADRRFERALRSRPERPGAALVRRAALVLPQRDRVARDRRAHPRHLPGPECRDYQAGGGVRDVVQRPQRRSGSAAKLVVATGGAGARLRATPGTTAQIVGSVTGRHPAHPDRRLGGGRRPNLAEGHARGRQPGLDRRRPAPRTLDTCLGWWDHVARGCYRRRKRRRRHQVRRFSHSVGWDWTVVRAVANIALAPALRSGRPAAAPAGHRQRDRQHEEQDAQQARPAGPSPACPGRCSTGTPAPPGRCWRT